MKNEINIAEYTDMLKEHLNREDIVVFYQEPYKNNSSIYTVNIGEEVSYSITVGYFEEDEEEDNENRLEDNFKKVADLTLNAYEKQLEEERKKEEEKASKS